MSQKTELVKKYRELLGDLFSAISELKQLDSIIDDMADPFSDADCAEPENSITAIEFGDARTAIQPTLTGFGKSIRKPVIKAAKINF